MALSAPDARLGYIAFAFTTVSPCLNLRSQKKKRFFQAWDQFLVFAGVRLQNVRYRALEAEIRIPIQVVRFQQPAALHVPAAVIIPIEMPAFFAGWSQHRGAIIASAPWCAWRKPITWKSGSSQIFPSARIDTNRVTLVYERGNLNFQPRLGNHCFAHAGGRVSAHCGA